MRAARGVGTILLVATMVVAGCSGQQRVGPAAQASPHVITLGAGAGGDILDRLSEELDLRGDLDLAWVGSRAWGSVGVNAFDALHAPFLVDSYDLEARVLDDPALQGPLAAALDAKGLALIGVLPGPMRLLFARARPTSAGPRWASTSRASRTSPSGRWGRRRRRSPSTARRSMRST
jgi:hypothetical protein